MTAVEHPFKSQTDEQRRAALTIANSVRIRRSELRGKIRRGEVNAVDVILRPPPYALTMRVIRLLESIPKIGPVKSRRILKALRVSESRTLGGLSARQRGELAIVLGGGAGAPDGGGV